MIKDPVSGHRTTLRVSGSPDIQGPPVEKKTRKRKRKKESTRVHTMEAEGHFLAKNKHKILKCGQKKVLLGGPRTQRQKDCQKAMMAFKRVVFAITSLKKAQSRIIPGTKARESSKKEKGKEEAHPQSGLSAPETPNEEGYGLPIIRLMIHGLQILGGSAQRLTLHGWWQLH